MVIGTATKKVTVTLAVSRLAAVQRLVADGKAPNVSAFVQRAVDVALQDAAGWRAMPDEALERTGGPLTRAEIEWADRALGVKVTKRRRRGAA